MRAAGLALLCAGVLAFAFASPGLAIRDVAVAGVARLDASVVRAASALDGENVFRASASAAAARVREVPGVRQARVGIALPGRATIIIDERVPALVVVSAGVRLFADEQGSLFPAAGGLEGLAFLEDESARRSAGESVEPGLVRAARQVAALQPAFFGRRVERIRLTERFGLVLNLDGGTEVRLGETALLDPKLEAARRIVIARAGRKLDYVDVRSLEGIAFFPKD